jgi:hypothetical protein
MLPVPQSLGVTFICRAAVADELTQPDRRVPERRFGSMPFRERTPPSVADDIECIRPRRAVVRVKEVRPR